jgi:preprotein translocase subunit YajC
MPSFGDTSGLMQLAPFALIFVVFYFLLIRPQQTKAKQHRSMLEALRRGDRVVTGGGIIGTVAKVVSEQEIQIDIADNVRVRVMRDTITTVLARTEPAAAKESDSEKTSAPALAANDGGKPKSLLGALGGMFGPKPK